MMRSDERSPSILHVIPSLALRTGGPSVNVINLCRALAELGVSVSIFTTDVAAPAQSPGVRAGMMVEEMPSGAGELDIHVFPVQHPYRLVYSSSLGRALRRSIDDFDLVHIHSLNLYPQFAASRHAKATHTPYVVSPRGALDPWILRRGGIRKRLLNAVWQQRMLNGAATLHLTTHDEERLVEPLKIAAPRVVIPNGIDLSAYQSMPDPSAFRTALLGGFDGPVILNHGRLSPKKGLDLLVKAFAEVRAAIPDTRLVLVGPDDEGIGDQLRALGARLGVAEAMTFPGMLRDLRLSEALAAADVWALPSHTENFGSAVIEAMASRKPVIVSSAVNIAPSAAADGAALVADNVDDLTSAIIRVLSEPTLRARLVANAADFVKQYEWKRVASEMANAYARILGNARERAPTPN